MRRTALLPALCLLAAFALSACSPAAPGGQGSEALSPVEPDTPTFLDDIGKPLPELKAEQPSGEVGIRLDGFPDHAAACFGEPGAEYASYFFGTQSGDAEKAMDECAPQLKCAGFVTTAGVLFPDMEDEMSFEDFFSLLGVDEYEYFGDDGDTTTAEGWLRFQYRGMEVLINTNEAAAGGGWDFTGTELVKRDAPASIADPELSAANQDLADAVMFD